jgi:hypothetical protein
VDYIGAIAIESKMLAPRRPDLGGCAPMRTFLIATLLLGLGACGKGGLEGDMKGWKDKMCKCTDKACTEKTMEDYRTWQKGKRDAVKDMSKADVEKLVAIEDELKACRKKYRDEGGEGAAAPTEKPAEGAAPAAPPAPAGDKPADK